MKTMLRAIGLICFLSRMLFADIQVPCEADLREHIQQSEFAYLLEKPQINEFMKEVASKVMTAHELKVAYAKKTSVWCTDIGRQDDNEREFMLNVVAAKNASQEDKDCLSDLLNRSRY